MGTDLGTDLGNEAGKARVEFAERLEPAGKRDGGDVEFQHPGEGGEDARMSNVEDFKVWKEV